MRKGFTLIELLVVIVIIASLATLLTANFIGVRQRGRDGQRKSDLRQIQTALELYRADKGNYPSSFPACESPFNDGASTVYLAKIPCDPLSLTSYVYTPNAGCDNSTTPCVTYTLYGCLENSSDSSKDTSKQSSCSTASYTLTNP